MVIAKLYSDVCGVEWWSGHRELADFGGSAQQFKRAAAKRTASFDLPGLAWPVSGEQLILDECSAIMHEEARL